MPDNNIKERILGEFDGAFKSEVGNFIKLFIMVERLGDVQIAKGYGV
jgi:hypothetical protein